MRDMPKPKWPRLAVTAAVFFALGTLFWNVWQST